MQAKSPFLVYLVFSQYIAEERRFGRLGADCHGQPEKIAKFEMPERGAMRYPRFAEISRSFAPGWFAAAMGTGVFCGRCRRGRYVVRPGGAFFQPRP
ncbi:hypothetical protein [Ferribacterium limneticum]|uniref:hypothetical protein n=1 Tax=Ferribacterium limneticum TaxID=76259 RepID=UPI001CFA86E6|nr:hypothetical protein [Ferribacterium limneticum]UCV20168.1 hypothetical protein KI610_06245 [Ferribacterium limneticum]